MIDQAAVARYHRDGFIVVEEVFSAAEIDAMRTALDRLVADASGVSGHDAVYDLEPGHTPARPRVRRIKTPTQVDPLYDRMIRHPKLLAILTQLLGPDLRLYGSKINIKAADYGNSWPQVIDVGMPPTAFSRFMPSGTWLWGRDAPRWWLRLFSGSRIEHLYGGYLQVVVFHVLLR